MMTFAYRMKDTLIPTVSAALGCSPTARVRSPQRVRKRMKFDTITRMIANQAIGCCSNILPNTGISERKGIEIKGNVPGA